MAVLAPSGGAYAFGNAQTVLSTAIVTAIDTSGNTVLLPDGQPDLVASAADAYLKSDDIYGHVVNTPLQVYGYGDKVESLAFSPDAHRILVSGTVSALLYSAETY
ncbi:MAG: hypothetical protein NTX53_16470, partial [candidate division WOR-3 bacterium]|nr:hypothetical protein [candidate division WOR-3 bacterium]